MLEYMAVSKRTLVVNIAFGLHFAIASTILPWMAYYISNWRYFTYVTAIPLLSVIITPWILPESARWVNSSSIKSFNFWSFHFQIIIKKIYSLIYAINIYIARWYVSNGMTDKVVEKLRRIAKINHKNPEPRIYDAFVVSSIKQIIFKEQYCLIDS